MSGLHRQALLTHSQRARSPLHMLIEEESPPTPPPKDPGYRPSSSMNVESPNGRPPSGSKRKREAQQDENVYELRNGRLEIAAADSPTPQKRSRSNTGRSDGNRSSDAAPAHRHKGSLRRKKGVGNLSNLNLRHAATRQMKERSPSPSGRESRFQEGSLTDKPSQQPPSAFTRFIRSESGNLMQVEELMSDYHNGVDNAFDPNEAELKRDTSSKDEQLAPGNTADHKKSENGGGIFRFGRSFATNFHPIALWNKVWNESKEELTRKNMLEAQRKARLRAEAQAKYEQMKKDGQFKAQHVVFSGNPAAPPAPIAESSALFDIASNGQSYQRQPSFGSHAPASQFDGASYGGSQAAEVPPSTAKTSRFSRLHIRTPSMSNLKNTLRNVRSHSALGGAIEREPSSSASPVKMEMDHSTLKKSVSRYDLKKERRLSKRVSNLESKLEKARMELSTALDDASPAPKFGSRYERFTPLASSKRSRFVPGALQTLPSERLMFPTGPEDNGTDQTPRPFASKTRPRNAIDLKSAFDNIDDEDEDYGDETVRASNAPYPAHAVELFQPEDAVIEDEYHETNKRDQDFLAAIEKDLSSDPIGLDDLDPNTPAKLSEDEMEESTQSPDFDSLGSKLEILENSGQAAKASRGKSRKRHFGAADDADALFVPDPDDEQSTELEETNPKKKRKSTSKSRGAGAGTKKMSGGGKAAKKSSIPVPSPKDKEGSLKATSLPTTKTGAAAAANVSEDELTTSPDAVAPNRISIDSDNKSLDPVYEEEEGAAETSATLPLKSDPLKPTAMSTPARYGRSNHVRSRSASPHKRSDSLQPGPMEKSGVLRLRPVSPPPPGGSGMQIQVVDDVVSAVVPGRDGVPVLPQGANGSFDSLVKSGGKNDENFEWPEDVF